MRHVIFSGSFCDAGLKKLATALPFVFSIVSGTGCRYILVVVDSTLRLLGGGETDRSAGEAERFIVTVREVCQRAWPSPP